MHTSLIAKVQRFADVADIFVDYLCDAFEDGVRDISPAMISDLDKQRGTGRRQRLEKCWYSNHKALDYKDIVDRLFGCLQRRFGWKYDQLAKELFYIAELFQGGSNRKEHVFLCAELLERIVSWNQDAVGLG